MNRPIQLQKPILRLLSLTMFAFLTFCLTALAVSPPPDGGYPGGNTAEGQNALVSRTTGGYNTALGFFSLSALTDGNFNTATGAGTLLSNTANENTAMGAGALLSNTVGEFNTAIGGFALVSNQGGSRNNAVGGRALFAHTAGDFNNAIGFFALSSDTGGQSNNAFGDEALFSNTTGVNNVAMGDNALHGNIVGSLNTAVGKNALIFSSSTGNTAIGSEAGSSLTTGGYNICIGADVTGFPAESNRIRIGTNLPTGAGESACYMGGIAGQTVGAGGSTCYVDTDGKLGVFLSARRFKRDIADMGAASETLLAMRPVTFRYKSELDKTGIPQFGLVAEEVAEVNPDLVSRDAKGDVYTVRYEAINAMLLNEFLKEHRKVEKLKSDFQATVEQHKKEMIALTAIVKEQAAQIERVSAQLESIKPVQQTIVNSQ